MTRTNGIAGLLAAVSLVAGAAAPSNEDGFDRATPESQGVDSRGILAWIDACEQKYAGGPEGRLHGFVIVRHGKVIAEGSWKPFDTLHETHMLWSHSKSFTSTAIGMLVDDGKLHIDDRVADIFPDKMPADPGERIRSLTVRDLLTMRSGMSQTDPQRKDPSGDWVKLYLANPVTDKPGTVYRYDSCATHVLSAIVSRKAGKDLHQFLDERLFRPLGIRQAWTTRSPTGVPCGGWGYNMTTRDLAKFGQLYLQKGRWGNRQIVSTNWVELATSCQTPTGRPGTGDWSQGYGFQFWRCRHGAYRADGMSGQLSVVLPEKDAVISVHAGLGDMQKELDLIWEHLLPALQDADALPTDVVGADALRCRCASLTMPPVVGGRDGLERYVGEYRLDDNERGFRAIQLKEGEDGLKMKVAVRHWTTYFPVGIGEWLKGTTWVDSESYEPIGRLVGSQPTQASGGMQTNGTFVCRVYLTGTTSYLDLTFSMRDGRRYVRGRLWGAGGAELAGQELTEAVKPADVPPLLTSIPWEERRTQILKAFTENEFGVRPVECPDDLRFETAEDVDILGGEGVRRSVKISCTGPRGPFAFTAHAFLPKGEEGVPAFVAVNLGQRLRKEKYDPLKDDPSIPSMPVREILAGGFAVVAFDNWEVAADDPATCFKSGVFRAYGPFGARKPTDWGALSAWAWGASRVVDWMETQSVFDLTRIGVIGHSRGGKTALWAGVTDSRFALVCVNDSGCGGAKLNHMDLPWSEDYVAIGGNFPHWFAPNFANWQGRERDLPWDHHQLLALVAPRKVAVGSATEDAWAGPAGERAAAELASPAWEVYGAKGWKKGIRHHFREGGHNLLLFDWEAYMDALD